MRKIINVCKEGIQFTDDKGNRQFIEFKECNRNWREQQRGMTGVTEEYLSQTVCVGERGWLYFLFYTEPITRIDFKRSIWCFNPKKAYHDLCMNIIIVGWSTYDLG